MILERLNKLPPFVCRLHARKKNGQESASCTDLAKRSGLSRSYIAVLSQRTTWVGIPVDVADKFAQACGVDFMAPWKVADYFRRAKQPFLRTAHPNQKRLFLKLMRLRPNKNAKSA